ncbi:MULTISPECIES: hypothetical protein [Burkholderiaceae]|uniref:hypothetical protein n=1 Tax=Burkholderiaceae TaxID=119060 RepID=UPI00196697EA|nr:MULTISPECIES: hypothetical protein [Burkholderiaceae]
MKQRSLQDDTMLVREENAIESAGRLAVQSIDPAVFIAPLAAAAYPFLLMLFHVLVGSPGTTPTVVDIAAAAFVLVFSFAAPMLGIAVACRPHIHTGFRRLAYFSVVAPTLYVFLGVVQTLLSSPIPDPWVWCVIWIAAVVGALRHTGDETRRTVAPGLGKWRVAHGVSAVILCFYVLFHLGNHLTGLIGPSAHAAVMDVGRSVYRDRFVEPVLVAAFLFQIVSGLYLSWRWSETRHDFFRTFQIASGAYLSLFILGHMNSVFIYARWYLHIPTDWNFATGAPTGLIHDPWNIRLLPHYALGVFFVLGHLVAGFRVVLNAHGMDRRIVNRAWFAGVAVSAVIAAAIIAGMCGVRI